MNRNIAFVLILFGLVVTTIEYSVFPKPRKSLICSRELFNDKSCSYECVTAGRGKGKCIWNDEKNSPRGSCLCELDYPNYFNSHKELPDIVPAPPISNFLFPFPFPFPFLTKIYNEKPLNR